VTEEASSGEGAASESAASAAGAKDALELVHHHPGRLRVRADVLREDEQHEASSLAVRVRETLEALPGVTRTTHNARTGSLLVEYEPGLVEPDAIVTRIAQIAGLASPFDPAARQLKSTTVAEMVVDGARELNAIVFELTGWKTDLRSIVPASLAALSAYSFIKTKEERLPRWDNLLWWSYSVFTQLHQREIQHRAVVREPIVPQAEAPAPDAQDEADDAEKRR
jgi:hypothetical protein